jgi:spermidine synthase
VSNCDRSVETSATLETAATERGHRTILLLSVLMVATCGLVYELISATMASYLLGDSVTQWSLVIGVYLSAMGLGSWLSQFIETRLHQRFIEIQVAIAWIGGSSATALFFGFRVLESVHPLLFGILTVVGTLVGLEIPLLMRIMQQGHTLKDLVARVLAFDYLGSLAASILFPLALLPYLGLIRTSFLFGLFNGAVALWSTHLFRPRLQGRGLYRRLQALTLVAIVALGCGFIAGRQLEDFGEAQLYSAPIVFSEKTQYQRLTITRSGPDFRLYIDGNLQFSSLDEYRYHEALVHPGLAVVLRERSGDAPPLRALVLGGGDGLALRELLKHPQVGRVDLVDLDPAMTRLFSRHELLAALNDGAFADPRVHVHNDDAMEWLLTARRDAQMPYDVAVVDLPDPNNFSLGKLYTRTFYRLLAGAVTDDAVITVQATSPYLAPRSFWCIAQTIERAGLHIHPFHANVPSFGEWGFVMATKRPMALPTSLPDGIERRFLADEMLASLFSFPADLAAVDVEINRLDDQMLVRYYEQDLESPWPNARN